MRKDNIRPSSEALQFILLTEHFFVAGNKQGSATGGCFQHNHWHIFIPGEVVIMDDYQEDFIPPSHHILVTSIGHTASLPSLCTDVHYWAKAAFLQV